MVQNPNSKISEKELTEPSQKELARQAIKGDRDAISSLMKLGEDFEKNGKFQEAAEAYRSAAQAYRIQEGIILPQKNRAEAEASDLKFKNSLFTKWISENPSGSPSLPYKNDKINDEFIRETILEKVLKDEEGVRLLRLLEDRLSDLGFDFFSPGGTIQRRATWLLKIMYGLTQEGENEEALKDPEARVLLESIIENFL